MFGEGVQACGALFYHHTKPRPHTAMNPNSLYNTNRSKLRKRNASARRLDVEADMQPVTECLASVGLTREQICRVCVIMMVCVGALHTTYTLAYTCTLPSHT